MRRMESGPESVETQDSIRKNRIAKLLLKLPEHSHQAIQEFLDENHEYGLALKIHGSNKLNEIKELFEKLKYKVVVSKQDVKEKRAQLYKISVNVGDVLAYELEEGEIEEGQNIENKERLKKIEKSLKEEGEWAKEQKESNEEREREWVEKQERNNQEK